MFELLTNGTEGVHPDFPNIPLRSTLPLPLAPTSDSQAVPTGTLPNIANVQGDVFLRFPKASHRTPRRGLVDLSTHQVFQEFIFFRIQNTDHFRTQLGSYKPTTSEDVSKLLTNISASKATDSDDADINELLTQIAFSKLGLVALGETKATGDPRFDKGSMVLDHAALGDGQLSNWDVLFSNQDVHGVIMVCAKSKHRTYYSKSVTILNFLLHQLQRNARLEERDISETLEHR